MPMKHCVSFPIYFFEKTICSSDNAGNGGTEDSKPESIDISVASLRTATLFSE